MKLSIGKSMLFLVGGLLLYSFYLGPQIAYWTRDTTKDYYNAIKSGSSFSVSLGYLQTNQKNEVKNVFERDGFIYSGRKLLFEDNITIPLSDDVRHNESELYLIATVKFDKENISLESKCKVIRSYTPRRQRPHKLLEKNENYTETPDPTPIPVRYKTSRFHLVYVNKPLNVDAMLPTERSTIRVYSRRNQFLPPLITDTFYDIPSELYSVNLSRPNITLNVEFLLQSHRLWTFKDLVTFVTSQNEMLRHQFNHLKKILLNNSAKVLWFTGILTVLQMIFQSLAFDRDIKYWRSKKVFKGISMRTVVLQLLGSVLTYLYLLDSDIPMNVRLIRMANIGLNLWKLTKFINVSFSWPFIHIRNEYKGDTNEADIAGMKFLYIIVTPIIVVYSVYQFLHGEFTSLMSYVIHCATGVMYSFGFLQMLPQLYVNYKLKTVAGLSVSAFIFKLINTFIDDVYAWVSDLPLMEKIAVLRDDFVFFIWLFQFMIYPVDPERENEFGLLKKDSEEEEKVKEKAD